MSNQPLTIAERIAAMVALSPAEYAARMSAMADAHNLECAISAQSDRIARGLGRVA